MGEYRSQVGQALDLLRSALGEYVRQRAQAAFGADWWQEIERTLSERNVEVRRRLAGAQTDEARLAMLDVAALLGAINALWESAFKGDLSPLERSYVNELRPLRNRWAHNEPFNAEDAYRALDTAERLARAVRADAIADQIKSIRDQVRQAMIAEERRSAAPPPAPAAHATTNLKPWREVITPHPDVSQGRYRQAEFAADLHQVLTGRATAEYLNPRDFFARTYFTEGLSELLARAWLRLSRQGGDPVVELQTNFGGGKTHTLLALYHLFGGTIGADDVVGIEQVTRRLSAPTPPLPRARRAVLACNALSADRPWSKPDGTQIRTLWGELAWQLGGREGYDLLADADRRSVSPGAQALIELFECFSPALVLIDEWVAYARQLVGRSDLPAGTFDSALSFVQALTEAARAVPDALVVAAIPASDVEAGGEHGRTALTRIRNVFGRLEAIWRPASMLEAFEIVRRRLFEPISPAQQADRDAVCRAFAQLYRDNRGEFPPECAEADYEARLKQAYPIHPELFDRLYQDWATLERFQLTRGVLRLMAAVVHELWARGDRSLMIMPGALPLDSQAVRAEFTRHLPDGWAPVLDRDVDGGQSQPLAQDNAKPNLGRYAACRRVARTVFVGSAPTTASDRQRGLDEARIKLGCVQPTEPPATFGDALRHLATKLTYLHEAGGRYYFDTRPTLNRVAEERAQRFSAQEVAEEVVERLRAVPKRGEFAAVHVAPADSSEVPDERACRLVILPLSQPHTQGAPDSPALRAAQDFLDRRGNAARLYRNALVFLAADANRVGDLEQAVRLWRAWTSIAQDKETLNLDPASVRTVEGRIREHEGIIAQRLKETYQWLLVPTQPQATEAIAWQALALHGEGLIERAARRLQQDGLLYISLAPALLRMELDRYLWQDVPHVDVKALRDYFAQYVYLPRLRDEQVLAAAIRSGVASPNWTELFAYAEGVGANGRYIGLVFGREPAVTFDGASVLVKPEAAQPQAAQPQAVAESPVGERLQSSAPAPGALDGGSAALPRPSDRPAVAPALPLNTRFHGSVELDAQRVGDAAGRVGREVISHLAALPGATVRVRLEIEVEVPDGVPPDKQRVVEENCATLRFRSHGFER